MRREAIVKHAKYLPAVLGGLLLVAFAAVVWWPAALGVAGALLLWLDNRIAS